MDTSVAFTSHQDHHEPHIILRIPWTIHPQLLQRHAARNHIHCPKCKMRYHVTSNYSLRHRSTPPSTTNPPQNIPPSPQLTMAFPRTSLRGFLTHAKTTFRSATRSNQKITLVIGNESAGQALTSHDLGSISKVEAEAEADIHQTSTP